MQVDEVVTEVRTKGWSRFSSTNIDLQDLIRRLGFIIMENDVSIDKKKQLSETHQRWQVM